MLRSTSLVLMSLVALACHQRDPDQAPPAPDQPRAGVSLLVRNHHWLDVTVYQLRGNVRHRLGTVAGSSEKRFDIQWSRLDGLTGLELAADAIGQRGGLTTDMIAVSPGSMVEWTIEGGMRSSSVTVF